MAEILDWIAPIAEYVVGPVVRQLGYVYNYCANIQNLSKKVEEVENIRNRLQLSVVADGRNGREIHEYVNKWLKSADSFIRDAGHPTDDQSINTSCFKGLCPNLKSRYQLGREATKKSGVADGLIQDGSKYGTSGWPISHLPALQLHHPITSSSSVAAAAPIPSRAGLESRTSILNAIMEALAGNATVNRIGVWGPGGVGKTTLVKLVAQQAAEKKLFDEVLFASVSSTPDYKKIQEHLADQLGIQFVERGEEARAARLRQRIMKIEKSILVILDDLWRDGVDLKRIGVPSPDDHKGCKLLLTSRDKYVLSNHMGTQQNFPIEELSEYEANLLFKNTAGNDSIKDPEFESLATEIAKECGGLPIAIVTVAIALKNKRLYIWKDALQQLKTKAGIPTTIPEMETKVYPNLRLSYDYLESDEIKSFFLLCSLISPNYIHIDDLLKYGMGLKLFKGIHTLEDARNRVDTLIDKLKASNLLLHTKGNAVVRMHDLIRNVAVEIASTQHHLLMLQRAGGTMLQEWPKMDELRMFIMRDLHVNKFPVEPTCPNLQFLGCYDLKSDSVVQIPNTFFNEMKGLYVLDLSRMCLPSLPSSLDCLTNLRTLCLDGCELGGDISLIMELKRLEVLSLMDSDIEVLPREITRLTRLRLLDLAGSSTLQVIPAGVIASLTQLENLCMENSFSRWEMEGKSNACIAELQLLSNLTYLDIQIPDVRLLPKDTTFFDKLERYRIFMGDSWNWRWRGKYETNKTLKLDGIDLHLADAGINKLLKRSEDLSLSRFRGGGGSNYALSRLDGEGFRKLKHLSVENCKELRYVVNSLELIHPQAFPVLVKLVLSDLSNLEEVCHGQFPEGCFGCLRKIKVVRCSSLKFLFSMTMANVVADDDGSSLFPKVRKLRLQKRLDGGGYALSILDGEGFPKLRRLTVESCEEIRDIKHSAFPVLEKLILNELSNLEQVCHGQFPAGSFGCLRKIVVGECQRLKFLFSMTMAKGLSALEGIEVTKCESMDNVVAQGSQQELIEEEADDDDVSSLFPKLRNLNLESLPKLHGFCFNGIPRLQQADLDSASPVLFDARVTFPSLEELSITGLDHVKKIWDIQLRHDHSFSNLKCVKWLQRLQNLNVAFCGSLEVVFDMEDDGINNVNRGVASTITQLSRLSCQSLPNLKQIWNQDLNHILSFRNLKSVEVFHCPSLKSLFSASLVLRDLVQLQELYVNNCGIEEVVAEADRYTLVMIKREPMMFVFPKLTSLKLSRLHQLKSFYPGSHTSQWPSLKELTVGSCDQVNLFASGTPTFQQALDETSSSIPTRHPLFLVQQQVAFPCLEKLTLFSNDHITELWQEQFPVDFPGLRDLSVWGHLYISVVIPPFMLQRLHCLEKLSVVGCNSIKEIFQLEGVDMKNQASWLGWLREIRLDGLPQLTHIWKGNSELELLELTSLEDVQVHYCESLKFLAPCSLSFQNLQRLVVRSCSSMRCLMSASIAKTLFKLKTLEIRESDKMEEVVDNGGEGEAMVENEIVFPNLKGLTLQDLPNLTSFSSGGFMFSFPCLEHMMVQKCPKMKIFSSGSATAPKLKRIEVAENEWHWKDNINTTLTMMNLPIEDDSSLD